MTVKPKLFMSCPLFTEALGLYDEHYELIFPDKNSPLTNMQQLTTSVGISAAVISSTTDIIDKALIEALPSCIKAIATYSVGTNHIDLDCAAANGLAIINTPDVLSESCADTALLLMLGAGRRAVEALELVKSGAWKGWASDQLLGKDLWGQRLGIFGMGRIGQAIAKRALGFGMDVHYHNRHQLTPEGENGVIYHENLESLMRVSDYFCISCPLTAENTGIIDSLRLSYLPSGAVLANISRGEIINDEALISALNSGTLAAAGLDVFTNEPDIHPAYREMKNVFTLPHLGSSTLATRLRMATILKQGLDNALKINEC
ncbi:UNVERIFIED_ORG: glyoxylate reductase [Rahnella aquatilis]